MVKEPKIKSLDELMALCQRPHDSRFKEIREGYRVCTVPLECFPLKCQYQQDGMRNLEEKDGKRKLYALCVKGRQPLRERWAKYWEAALPQII